MPRLRLTLALLLAAAGCQGFPPVQPCTTEIPAGGCPAGRGGTCEDPTCDALYDCLGGEWTRVQACPMRDGGAGGAHEDGGGAGLDAGSVDASNGDACTPVHIDLAGKTSGCTPDLENPPDCPVEAALGCAESACFTSCSDFFLCKATSTGPQWIDVAYCNCDGQLVVTQ